MGHVMVEDQARQNFDLRFQEIGSRLECLDNVPSDLQQEPKRVPYGVVIVNYRYRSLLGLGHA